jgi:hypothetical protein
MHHSSSERHQSVFDSPLAAKATFIAYELQQYLRQPMTSADNEGLMLTESDQLYCQKPLLCQGGGAATQMPAEHYHSGSNPDLGFWNSFVEASKNFY